MESPLVTLYDRRTVSKRIQSFGCQCVGMQTRVFKQIAEGRPAGFLKAKPLTNTAKCTNCGICAEVCPMWSVFKENYAEVPGICIKCQACVLKCPAGAKYFADEAYLSHVRMLENNFAGRKEPEWYCG